MNKILIKRFLAIIILIIVGMSMFAQTVTTLTHILQRGETLESVAARYSTTPQDIISLNPEAGEFTYVGMELKIPASTQNVTATPSLNQATPQTSPVSSSAVIYTEGQPVSSYPSDTSSYSDYTSGDNSWCSYGVFYMANFKAADKGAYGAFFEAISSSGIGAYGSLGLNYGIVKPGGIQFRFGPTIGHRTSENVILSCPLTLTLSTFDHVGKILKSGNQSTDQKIGWGLAAMPRVGLKIDNVCLTLGLDVNYTFKKTCTTDDQLNGIKYDQSYGDKAYVGFFVGIGLYSN